MKKFVMSLVLLLMLATGVVAGLLPATHGQPLTGTPQRGGVLVGALAADPPHLMSGATSAVAPGIVSRHIYQSLIKFDFEFNPVPELAKSWEISEDHLSYTFHLEENAVWSDGVPLTSADVKFSYEKISGVYHPRTSSFVQSYLASIETPDEHTVIFKTNSEYGPLFGYMSRSFLAGDIFPQHIWENSVASLDTLLANPAAQQPIGSGPFVLTEWVKGDHLTLERNPKYWVKDQPYLDRIVYRIMPDPVSRVLALEQGEVDLITQSQMPQSEVGRLQQNPNIYIPMNPTGHEGAAAMMYVFFNTKRAPFDNVLVRQGIAHALDRNLLMERAVYGLAIPATGPIPKAFTWAYNPDVHQYPFDLAKANELLDQSGYTLKSDGTRFKATWLYTPEEFDHGKVAELAVQMLKQVGIVIELRPMETGAMEDTLFVKWDFDLAGCDAGTLFDPELGVRRMYDGTAATHTPYTNPTGYNNPVVNDLFDKAARSIDHAVRGPFYKQMSAIVMEDLPIFQLYEKIQVAGMKSNILNIPITPYDMYMNSYATVGYKAVEVTTTAVQTTETQTTPVTAPDYTMYYAAVVILVIVAAAGIYAYSKRKTKS
jgi:peptide/nickel transport system substrate-binding protein